jgi:diacylglycerol kinase family enzyme
MPRTSILTEIVSALRGELARMSLLTAGASSLPLPRDLLVKVVNALSAYEKERVEIHAHVHNWAERLDSLSYEHNVDDGIMDIVREMRDAARESEP